MGLCLLCCEKTFSFDLETSSFDRFCNRAGCCTQHGAAARIEAPCLCLLGAVYVLIDERIRRRQITHRSKRGSSKRSIEMPIIWWSEVGWSQLRTGGFGFWSHSLLLSPIELNYFEQYMRAGLLEVA